LEHLDADYKLLTTLACSFNNLIDIPYYPQLKYLCCAYNHITHIGEYPRIRNLICYNNHLTSISNYPLMVRMDFSDNLVDTMPNILEWNNLEEFHYSGNPVEYIPPNIARRIDQIRRRFIGPNARNIFNDTQNVHNHHIQKSIIDSIQNIIKDKPDIDFYTMMTEIIDIDKSEGINDDTKRILLEFVENTEVHSVLGITFKELLLSVWSIIRKNPEKERRYIIEILNMEMTDSVCKCFTGRMSRLINCLNGIDERVSITISDNEQIGNIIITIMKKLEEKSEYTIELHRELVEKELIERGFTQDIIQIWIDSIE
jgi:hypothetical protein